MGSEVFQLAILLSLKDAASGGLNRFEAQLRAAGKEGEKFHSEFEKIRKDLNRDLAIGGVGIAGLSLFGKGVKVAADFQASMTDLRTSITQVGKDGKVNFDALGQDMAKAETIAMRLGNDLPGTTEDFVQMMQVLKQNGLQTETIMDGAADAIGRLAVANKVMPKEIAADLAQFGNLFKLKGQDFTAIADTFSRINTSTGQTSDELVEAAKYFEGRAGTSLGITGLKDAQEMTRLFGMMGMQGMRGSMAGMSLTDFFSEYTHKLDKVKDLAEQTGIKLDFFDKAGKFVGLDSVFQQMQQFDKLSQKDQGIWKDKIFGLRGMNAANIFQGGTAAWKSFNTEQDKTISLAAKNAEISKNFNNQLEALTGSLKNLVVTGFGPMLPMLTGAATSANAFVGSLTDFARVNPGLMQTLGTLALYGTTATVLYGGIKTLTNGFQLLRLAMKFSRGDSTLSFFTETANDIKRANGNVAGFTGSIRTAEKKVGGLKSAVQGFLSPEIITLAVEYGTVMTATTAIGIMIDKWSEANEKSNQILKNSGEISKIYEEMFSRGALYKAAGDTSGKADYQTLAQKFEETIQHGNDLQIALRPETVSMWDKYFNPAPFGQVAGQNPLINHGARFNPETAANMWRGDKTAVALRDVNVLAQVIRDLQGGKMTIGDTGRTFSGNELPLILKALEGVVTPERFAAALKIVNEEKKTNPAPAATFNPFDFFGKNQFQGFKMPGPLATVPKFDINRLDRPVFTPTTATSGPGSPVKPLSNPKFPALFDLNKNFGKPQGKPFELPMMQDMGKSGQAFDTLNQHVGDSTTKFEDLNDPAGKIPGKFQGISMSSVALINALQGVGERMGSWSPPNTTGRAGGSTLTWVNPGSGNAVGGEVKSDGMAFVHAGNVITPARTTKGLAGFSDLMSWARERKTEQDRFSLPLGVAATATRSNTDISLQLSSLSPKRSGQFSGDSQRNGTSVTINAPVTVHINGADEQASAKFQDQLSAHSKHIERLVTRTVARQMERS